MKEVVIPKRGLIKRGICFSLAHEPAVILSEDWTLREAPGPTAVEGSLQLSNETSLWKAGRFLSRWHKRQGENGDRRNWPYFLVIRAQPFEPLKQTVEWVAGRASLAVFAKRRTPLNLNKLIYPPRLTS